jgi:hypothetical protein
MTTGYCSTDLIWLREELAKERPSPDCSIVFERIAGELIRLRTLVAKTCVECETEGQPVPGVHCDTCGEANFGAG